MPFGADPWDTPPTIYLGETGPATAWVEDSAQKGSFYVWDDDSRSGQWVLPEDLRSLVQGIKKLPTPIKICVLVGDEAHHVLFIHIYIYIYMNMFKRQCMIALSRNRYLSLIHI